jgi:aspartokinase
MSISDFVRVYLKNKPYTVEALENGIVNYSALARVVQRSLRIKNYHAIKAALRRYAEELREMNMGIEKHASEMLNESSVTIQSGVSVIISPDDVEVGTSSKIKLRDYYVYLTYSPEEFKKLKKAVDVTKMHENASAIVIHSGEKLEDLPGFVAFIASILAEQNINIIEFISCYTETLLVVGRSDALKSHELLLGGPGK